MMHATTEPLDRRRGLVAAVVLAALVVALFWSSLGRLVQMWFIDPSYSHGFFVLPLCVALGVWVAVCKAGWPAEGEIFTGAAVLLLGCIVRLFTVLAYWPLVDFVALVLVLRGTLLLVGGRHWARPFWFPVLFTFFMFPLPVAWTSALAVWLQDVVARAAAGVLGLFVVCYRRGNALYLAGQEPLAVAEACSGLRQMIAFLALGALVAYFSRLPVLLRIAFVLSAVPVAIIANVVRVVLMALGVKFFGAAWLTTWMHDIPGIVTLPVGLVLLLLIGWLLHKLAPSGAACSRSSASNAARVNAKPAAKRPPVAVA